MGDAAGGAGGSAVGAGPLSQKLRAGERFSTETGLGWLHGKPGAGRSVDRLRAGPAERRARRREEEPRAAPRRGESRLPITLLVSGDSADSAVLADALAAKALRALEKFDRAFPFRDGRMMLPHSLAVDIVRRLGGTVQLAFA